MKKLIFVVLVLLVLVFVLLNLFAKPEDASVYILDDARGDPQGFLYTHDNIRCYVLVSLDGEYIYSCFSNDGEFQSNDTALDDEVVAIHKLLKHISWSRVYVIREKNNVSFVAFNPASDTCSLFFQTNY